MTGCNSIDMLACRRAESICLGEMAEGRPPSPRQKKAVEVLKAAAAAAECGFNCTVAKGHPAPHHSSSSNPMSEAQLQEELMKVWQMKSRTIISQLD